MKQISSPPKVSVVMPVYNSEKHLSEAIESILRQTFRDFEFIIVCDPSADKTLEVAKSYELISSCIIIVNNEKRIGLVESLNRGLMLARGELIAILDADDVSLPKRLAKQVAFMESNPDIGILGTGMEVIDDKGKRRAIVHPPTNVNVVRWKMLLGCCIAHSSAMMKADTVRQVGSYRLERCADGDLWARAIAVTKLANMREVLIKYRLWEGNTHTIYSKECEQADISVMQTTIKNVLGIDISVETAMIMRRLVTGQRLHTLEHIEQASNLLRHLHQAYMRKFTLTNAEAKQTNQDVSTKLCLLAFWAGRLSFTRGLALLMQGLKMSRRPLYVLPAESAKKRFMRLVRGNMDW